MHALPNVTGVCVRRGAVQYIYADGRAWLCADASSWYIGFGEPDHLVVDLCGPQNNGCISAEKRFSDGGAQGGGGGRVFDGNYWPTKGLAKLCVGWRGGGLAGDARRGAPYRAHILSRTSLRHMCTPDGWRVNAQLSRSGCDCHLASTTVAPKR